MRKHALNVTEQETGDRTLSATDLNFTQIPSATRVLSGKRSDCSTWKVKYHVSNYPYLFSNHKDFPCKKPDVCSILITKQLPCKMNYKVDSSNTTDLKYTELLPIV